MIERSPSSEPASTHELDQRGFAVKMFESLTTRGAKRNFLSDHAI
jgi:hypothetical protein